MKRLVLFAIVLTLAAAPLLAADPTTSAPGCAKHSASCCAQAAGVERSVEKLADGVRITMTAKDAKTVAMVQECADKGCKDASCPMSAKGVTRKVEKTATGVVITATATDPALVTSLQNHSMHTASAEMTGKCAKPHGESCCKKAKQQPAAASASKP
jgi:hypothetical protein